MSWLSLQEAVIWLSISKEIDNLEKNIYKSINNERLGKVWISLSERLLYLVEKNIKDKLIKKTTLGIIRYLRCMFFWSTYQWEYLENEVDKGIKEDVDSSIYLMIKGFIYLRPLSHISAISEIWPNGFPYDKKKELLSYAQKCFKAAIKKCKNDQESIVVAIKWANAWMLIQTDNLEKSKKCALEALEIENGFGQGWTLWMRWIGSVINENDHIKLINL